MYAGGCTYVCSRTLTEQTLQKRPCGEGNTLFGPHAKFALQNSPPVSLQNNPPVLTVSDSLQQTAVPRCFAPPGC